MAKDTARRHASFSALFHRQLKPVLEELEEVRKRRALVLRVIAVLILLGTVWMIWAFGDSTIHYLVFSIPAMCIGAVVVSFWETISAGMWDRIKLFSEGVIAPIVDYAMPGMTHRRFGQISTAHISRSWFFGQGFNRVRGRDLFLGRGRGYSYSFSWAKVEYIPHRTWYRSGQPYRHFFTGWFFVIAFGKQFEGETMALPDRAEAALGPLGRSIQAGTLPPGGRLIQLEDPDFERYFKIISTGEMDARYALSPAFMRCAVQAVKRVGGTMSLAFMDNCMYVAVPAVHEYFSNMPIRSFLDPAFARQLYHAVRSVDELAKTVAAHQKVWYE